MVAAIIATRTCADWTVTLLSADIPMMPLHSIESLIDDPHLRAVGFFEHIEHPSEGALLSMKVPSRWSRSQPRAGLPAPRLGQHSAQVLKEIGYSDTEIAALAQLGATYLGQPDNPACGD
jgi:crotonobetainyl-CoA:carnitine CoA-transferase CaiB-like acyl-CoA transferase